MVAPEVNEARGMEDADTATQARPPDPRILEVRFLRGPNLYAYMPVMRATLDIGDYADLPSTAFPDFVPRLIDWLPGLLAHECSVGRPGGFVERLRRGTYFPHIVEHVTLELQKLCRFNVTFGRARGTGERGVYSVVIAYREEEPARACLETAVRLVLAAMHGEPWHMPAELAALERIADTYRLGPSTQSIVDAARRRGIPVMRVIPTGGLIQLGWGVHQKRIRASETSNTSAIAVDICQDKTLTNKMLRAVGVPVPEGRPVTSADEAWEAARRIGLPVVVKPESGNQGKGVSVNLTTEAEVRDAYAIAETFRRNVIVEQYIEGADYRLLVVGGKMVAASRRDPAQIVGTGSHSIRQLVETVNRDPRRRDGHGGSLTRIVLDGAAELALSQQGYTFDSVPPAGQAVLLRQNCNLSTGGTAVDVTDEVCPENARMAELAAQVLSLDVAGIDVLCADITRPMREQRGAIVEVNAAPGLRMHLDPSEGRPRDVGRDIIDMLYPDHSPARIPIIAVTGTNGKTTVARLLAHIYQTAHRCVGLTSTEGAYINGDQILKGDSSGPQSARAVLLHPHVQVAILETARGGILREGLAFDRCRVGVVTNISSDHLGLRGIDTVEDLARVKQVVIESVDRKGAAVLNADDALVSEMAAATDASVVYFSRKPDSAIIRSHLADGGRCVISDGRAIFLVSGGATSDWTELVELNRVPFTAEGRIGFQVQNALAAAAAAWAAGVNPALIARALTTFKSNPDTAPGRFNVIDRDGVEIVLDYGHNAAAMSALGEALAALEQRRTVMLVSLPGDRRDEDLHQTMRETVRFADEYVLYDAEYRRGRAPMEMPRLMRSALPTGKAAHEVPTFVEGLQLAWTLVKPGDRILVTPEDVPAALDAIASLGEGGADDGHCSPAPESRDA